MASRTPPAKSIRESNSTSSLAQPLLVARRVALRGAAVGSVGLACVLGAGGCGHEATEADCELIADRIVQLELEAQHVTDPREIERRRSEMLGIGATKRAALEGCVGRHISDKSLECVRQAKTAEEITDKCLH